METNLQPLINTPLAGRTPLTKAILNHDSHTIKELINLGADINQPSEKGLLQNPEKPLITAMKLNLLSITKDLLAEGASTKYQCNLFSNPLETASNLQNPEYTKLILANNSPIFFPLACTNPLNIAIRSLSQYPNEIPPDSLRPTTTLPSGASTIASSIAEELILAGLHPNLHYENNTDPLGLTIMAKEFRLALLLLDAGARVTTTNLTMIQPAVRHLKPPPTLSYRIKNPSSLLQLSRTNIRSTLRKTFNKDIRKVSPSQLPLPIPLIQYLKMVST